MNGGIRFTAWATKCSANGRISVCRSRNGGTVVLNANYTYVDETFTDIGELSLRESVELLNASISYESPGERYRVSVYGTNLTDEIYVNSRTIVPPLFDYRNVSPPRQWGVEFGWNL